MSEPTATRTPAPEPSGGPPVAEALASHGVPRALERRPALVRLLHRAAALSTLRTWHVRAALRRTLGALPRPFRLLDAGCGGGDLLRPLAERHGPGEAAFVGVDRAAANVRLVREYARRTGLSHVRAVHADLSDYAPRPDAAPFDVVLCSTVLQYVEDDAGLLRRFADWLRPGGRLVLYVPVHDERVLPGFDALRRRLAGAPLYDDVQARRHVHAADEVLGKLTAAGFSIDAFTHTDGTAGRLYFELQALVLAAVGRGGLAAVAGAVAGAALAPLLAALLVIDFSRTHRRGNGLLVTARRV